MSPFHDSEAASGKELSLLRCILNDRFHNFWGLLILDISSVRRRQFGAHPDLEAWQVSRVNNIPVGLFDTLLV